MRKGCSKSVPAHTLFDIIGNLCPKKVLVLVCCYLASTSTQCGPWLDLTSPWIVFKHNKTEFVRGLQSHLVQDRLRLGSAKTARVER